MISVAEATSIIQSHLFQPSPEMVPLADALNKYLAETVVADRDFPAFDRVMMDGIALSSGNFSSDKSYQIEATQFAGASPLTLNDRNNCVEVMTGAVLPGNTDAVIRYEDLNVKDGMVRINLDAIEPYQNVQRQGVEAVKGSVLLSPGHLITPATIGVLATVGKDKVEVYSSPRVMIVSTGDELVPVDETPEAYQIRQSNSHTLVALFRKAGIDAVRLHLTDNREGLRRKLSEVLDQYDLVLLTGGVSKGKKDYVPEVLDELGVQKHFHRVAQKPAKPLWFGSRGNTFVFGLPGNPVSTFLGYHRYVLAWLSHSYSSETDVRQAILKGNFELHADLTYFLQVKLTYEDGHLMAEPVTGKGSGDLLNLTRADGFLELPDFQSSFKSGEIFRFIPFK